MRKFDETFTFSKDEKMQYLTAFDISVEINLPDETTSLLEKEEIETSLALNKLKVVICSLKYVTWDLSMLKFQVKELELASLRQRFETAGYFIPKSEKFFLTKDTNNIELWFEEV